MQSQSKRWNNRVQNEQESEPGSAGRWRPIMAVLVVALAAFGAADAFGPARAFAQDQEAESVESAERSADLVNIQTASEEELQSLPGIGPSKAAAIVAYRERRPFRSIREIMRVRGIGRATFRRLRPLITVDGGS